jgi:hypothetical protein
VQRPRRRRIEEFEQRGLGSGLRWNLASSGKENDAAHEVGVVEHPSFNLYERRANKLDKKIVVNFIQTRFEREAYPHTGACSAVSPL